MMNAYKNYYARSFIFDTKTSNDELTVDSNIVANKNNDMKPRIAFLPDTLMYDK